MSVFTNSSLSSALLGVVCVWALLGSTYAEGVEALGGDQVAVGVVGGTTYRYHVFTTVGAAQLSVASGGDVECLVVGGGGGGGDRVGGGGGAGGLILTNLVLTGGSNYVVNVGNGGQGSAAAVSGADGAPSVFDTFTVMGGGGGGGYLTMGRDGGSGGGAPGYSPFTAGSGSPGQGHDGGGAGSYGGGGGGGAGAAGGDWKGSNVGGDGGDGIDLSYWFGDLELGDDGWLAGGGGGSGYQNVTASVGGKGGGGYGGLRGTSPASGLPNTGGGGGGRERFGDAGNGGSGIVVVRYPSEGDAPQFVPIFDPLVLANLETGSERFTNSNRVEVVGLPVPAGYTHYKITESGDVAAAETGSWLTLPPGTLTTSFTQPAADTNITLYAWFTNTADSVSLQRAKGDITHTSVAPVTSIFSHRRLGLAEEMDAVSLTVDDVDAGSTGGTFGETGLLVFERALACIEDQTPESPEVTLNALGTYTVVLTLVNEAGNAATATSTVSVASPGTYPYYVNAANTGNVEPPYATWATAATNIRDAVLLADADVDVAAGLHGEVIVADGLYVVTSALTVTKPLLLKSVSGEPETTVVSGGYPSSTNRCLLLTGAAIVDGLTFTNGYVGEDSFLGNKGGGIYMTTGTVQNCRIVGNGGSESSVNTGGAGNVAGAGVYMEGGILSNSLVQANYTDGGAWGTGIFARNASSTIADCRILDNGRSDVSFTGGGGLYLDGGARVIRGMIAGNLSRTSGGGAHLNGNAEGKPLLSGCVISNNYAYDGAGVHVYFSGDLDGCTIVHNESPRYGGGLYIKSRDTLVRNCLVAGNQSTTSGGGVYNAGATTTGSSVNMSNCTIVRNESGVGGGVYAHTLVNNTMTLFNTIVHANLAGTESNNVYFASDIPVARYNCTTPVLTGDGNLDEDPLFTNPGEGTGLAATLGDYTLLAGSPCRDSGLNEDWMTAAVDLAGTLRILPKRNGTVDMGAYEIIPLPGGTTIVVR